MADEVNELPPSGEKKTSQLGDRSRILAAFINAVGLPVFIVVSLMAFVALIALGYIPSPWVSSAAFEQHQAESSATHKATIKNSEEQTKVLGEIQTVLKGITCNQYPTDALKLACFQRVDGTHEWN